ncbi:DUF3289 family protein [Streptomyces kunmingensis]|uniref:DUF3289 family protein n=1 Tax=Streptomyces kunmingensis TaxID=68225 RepID=A0ABU6C7X3_9ACTN|nr:DUF3289 family protein [Streptomyces kunmingensis]MEB3959945.1 DUF3289 family protein [Streptomyces kunmingensis]
MLRRVTMPFTALLLLLGTAAPAVAGNENSSAPGKTIYRDDAVDVSYRQLPTDDSLCCKVPPELRGKLPAGSYIAQLQIKNVSRHEIADWSLTFELPDRITATESAKLDAQRGRHTTIQNAPATKEIQPGATSTIWYRAQADGTAHTPAWATFAEDGARPTKDTDGDGLPDDVEQRAKLDPSSKDTDHDGLSDFVELGNRSNPLKGDSDGDGVRDGMEDPDGDDVPSRREVRLKTSLVRADSDADGLDDGKELARHTSPAEPDTDGDGVDDGRETRIGSDPRVAESAFDVTQSVNGGATTASATLKGVSAEQASTFRITKLPADQKQFPKSTPGYVGNGYEFAVDGGFDEAKISFRFDAKSAGPDFEPAIYGYDEKSQRLVRLADQQVDGDAITATATSGNSTKYVLLNKRVFDKVWDDTLRKDSRQESDLSKDTDHDGISDFYEKEMRAGNLVLGNGVPVGAMDPENPDSDGDALKDGKEVQIVKSELSGTKELVYAKLASNPLKPDTDGDGSRDRADRHPLVFDQPDMLIHQSANREGRRKEPDPDHFQVPPSRQVADDLTFNDYTYDELFDLDWSFWNAGITPEFLMWGEFNDIMNAGKFGADSDNQQAVDDLRNAFRYGHNGESAGSVSVDDNYDPARFQQVGSGSALSRAVAASPQEQKYIDQAKGLIVQSITDNRGGTAQFQVQDDLNKNLLYQLFKNTGVQYPVYDFSVGDANQRALSIAIHQFHGHTIQLKDYKVDGNTFSGKLLFHSYDHFGLDPDDEITNYGFIDWFTLQHYDRFDGKYAPPVAVADVEIPISGSF